MRKILTLILTILFSNILFAQTFQIGHTTINFIDTSRSNRSIATEVYYPADVAGDDEPVTITTNDKFPVVSFGHGFVMTWNAYQNIWDAVVQEGFIIAFPKTEGGLAPSHAEFGKDLAFVISELTTLSQDTSSLFYNRVDTMNCVMGHSMGGGAAFLAAQFDPSIKTIATLAAAETNPSAIQAAASLSIPSLIIAGGNDCVTPPPANQVPMYDSLQSSCKTYVSINGGSHCQMADNNFLCSIGEATCTPQPTITRAEQHVVISNYLLPWLKYELKGDCFSGAQFDSLITTDTSIVFQKTCLLCNTSTSIENNSTLNIEIFPNPFQDDLFIQNDQNEKSKVLIDLFVMNGARIYSQNFSNVKANEKLKLSFKDILPAGIYLLKVTMDGQHSFRKVIKY
ncbi:MAG: T9SS type A sorting domain-containing protein [Bacteroidetes bacterium]|nr:T9SS type A sorting domain-containing protein [Bacteroidota bacterium]